jgi:arylsulfatase A-like enzyme
VRVIAKLFTSITVILVCHLAWAGGKATHVVVVVWDGMRPDFVNEKMTPTLWRMAREGVLFQNHHPVYPSSTEVNGTALATGVYGEKSGVIGNDEYRPAINNSNAIMTADPKNTDRGDEITGNHFLRYATVAETLHAAGLNTAIAGAKLVALLQDRHPGGAGGQTGSGADIFEGKVRPESMAETIRRVTGKFPRALFTKRKRDRWTTRALIDGLWAQGLPPFSLLWLSEPDYSQHRTGPGSRTSRNSIRSSDKNLAHVLEALEKKGVRDQTDVIVVSDHAFSTIGGKTDLPAALTQGGFHTYRKFSPEPAKEGDVLVVGNGGSSFLYVIGHNQRLIEQIVRWLQQQPYTGVILTRSPVEGAFQLGLVKINSPEAPDIVLSFRWTPDLSGNGTPGLLETDMTRYGSGKGMHGSLSRFDMHNTCIAAGPDFRKGYEDHVPTGNIDIAPTVLWILGVEPKQPLSGRVITEALTGLDGTSPEVQSARTEASYQGNGFLWLQYLNYSLVNGVTYVDEGNGEQRPQPNFRSK